MQISCRTIGRGLSTLFLVYDAPPRFEGTPGLYLKLSSLSPVIREFLRDIRIHRLGVVYIQVAFRNRAVALLGQPSPVQRRGQSRVDLEGGVEIGNGILGLPAFQVDQAPAVEGVDEIRT